MGNRMFFGPGFNNSYCFYFKVFDHYGDGITYGHVEVMYNGTRYVTEAFNDTWDTKDYFFCINDVHSMHVYLFIYIRVYTRVFICVISITSIS